MMLRVTVYFGLEDGAQEFLMLLISLLMSLLQIAVILFFHSRYQSTLYALLSLLNKLQVATFAYSSPDVSGRIGLLMIVIQADTVTYSAFLTSHKTAYLTVANSLAVVASIVFSVLRSEGVALAFYHIQLVLILTLPLTIRHHFDNLASQEPNFSSCSEREVGPIYTNLATGRPDLKSPPAGQME